MKIIDRHPEVKKAIAAVDSKDHNLTGLYWREAVEQELAKQFHSDGHISEVALDWADHAITEYENDNG